MIAGVKQSGYGLKMWNDNGDLIFNHVLQAAGSGFQYSASPQTTNALPSSSYTAAFYHDNTLIKKFSFVVGD